MPDRRAAERILSPSARSNETLIFTAFMTTDATTVFSNWRSDHSGTDVVVQPAQPASYKQRFSITLIAVPHGPPTSIGSTAARKVGCPDSLDPLAGQRLDGREEDGDQDGSVPGRVCMAARSPTVDDPRPCFEL